MNDETNTTNNETTSPWAVFGLDGAGLAEALKDAAAEVETPNLFEVGVS